MIDEAGEDGDLEWARLLADSDDALASGFRAADIPGGVIPPELRPWLEREVGWCRLVRQCARPGRSGRGVDLAGDRRGSATRAWRSPGPLRAAARAGAWGVRRRLPRLRPHASARGRAEGAAGGIAPDGRAPCPVPPRGPCRGEPGPPQHRPGLRRGRVGAISFIASAYCPGETLAAWLRRRDGEPVPYRVAARLAWVLGGAVAHAHRRGILHRDLKPGNILLEAPAEGGPPPDGALGFTPRITDFGLAKVLSDANDAGPADMPTMTGAILGTPSYMAPEQAEGRTREVGRPSDVYALGAILYELLTGRPPFQGRSLLETLQMIRSREPVMPSRLQPKVPRDLETICLKCLQKDPARRYPDAEALVDDLRRFLDGEAISARPVGPLRRMALRCRRNPVVASTVIAATLAVLLVAGVGIWRVVRERDRFRGERDRAEANLYRARLGEARGRSWRERPAGTGMPWRTCGRRPRPATAATPRCLASWPSGVSAPIRRASGSNPPSRRTRGESARWRSATRWGWSRRGGGRVHPTLEPGCPRASRHAGRA